MKIKPIKAEDLNNEIDPFLEDAEIENEKKILNYDKEEDDFNGEEIKEDSDEDEETDEGAIYEEEYS